MAYADYNYYLTGYLLGKEPAVPQEEFRFYERDAAKEIDMFTLGRMKADLNLDNDDVKDCVCAVTELLYKANSMSEQAFQNGAVGVLSSYSNDGESGTYDLSQSIYTESGKKKEIKRLVLKYLENTGLLYAGVRCCEP